MRFLIIIVALAVGNIAYSHDLRMAIFEISQEDDGYKLNISLDKNNFLKSLLTNYPELAKNYSEELLEKYIASYMEGNLLLTFDDVCSEITINSVEYQKENIYIKAELEVSKDHVSRIEVLNTLMIDYNEGHLNIIKFRVNESVRTFKLSEERISTVVEY